MQPQVIEFLDYMVRQNDGLRFELVKIPEGSPWLGKTLRDVPIRQLTSLLVVAIREATGSYVYNPPADYALAEKAQLIVMGEASSVAKLRTLMREGTLR